MTSKSEQVRSSEPISQGSGRGQCPLRGQLLVRRLNQYSAIELRVPGSSIITDPAKLLTRDVGYLEPNIIIISHESMDHMEPTIITMIAAKCKAITILASAGAFVNLKAVCPKDLQIRMVLPGDVVECHDWIIRFGRSNHGFYLEPLVCEMQTPMGTRVFHAFDSFYIPRKWSRPQIALFPAGITPGISEDTFRVWTNEVRPVFAISSHHLDRSLANLRTIRCEHASIKPLPWDGWIIFAEEKPLKCASLDAGFSDPEVPAKELRDLAEYLDGKFNDACQADAIELFVEPTKQVDRLTMARFACLAQLAAAGQVKFAKVAELFDVMWRTGQEHLSYIACEILGWAGTFDEITAQEALLRLAMAIIESESTIAQRRKAAFEVVRILRRFPHLANLVRLPMLLALKDQNPDVRVLAVMALEEYISQIMEPDVIGALTNCLYDSDFDVLSQAAKALIPFMERPDVYYPLLKVAERNFVQPPPLCDICAIVLDRKKRSSV